MSITAPNFSAVESLSIVGRITFTDTSIGSDVSVTERRIFATDDLGQPIVQDGTTTDYEVWAYPMGTPVVLDLLKKAQTPRIRVDWMNGASVVVSKTLTFSFLNRLILAGYNLTRTSLSKPRALEDVGYYQNKMKLALSIDDANNAIYYGGDVVNAQSSLDRGTLLIQNESINF